MVAELSVRLKDLRTKYGYSQAQIATRLGLTTSVVSAYECAAREPSLSVLISLANIYKCSTDYLLGLTTSSFRKTMQPFTDDQAMALISFINNNREQI